VKEFVVYTALRIVLFLASFGIVVGIMAFLVSGVASYYVLDRQREAFARRVESRAARASAAFEERKAREDGE
jgi:uncharacterized membrane protein